MAEEAETEAPKKGSKKLVIILVGVIAVLVLGLGGFAATFLLGGDEVDPAAPVAEVKKDKTEAIYVKIRTEGGKPYFIANFTGDKGSQRFLQVYVEVRTRDEAVKEELGKHMPLIVSQLQMLFSSQSLRDMQTAEGRLRLQVQATEMIQALLKEEMGKPGIETVLFTNFVMQ